jgi:IS30 family transposase
MDEILSRIWNAPGGPAQFAGINRLYREAKKELPKLRKQEVKEWLESQKTYTLHLRTPQKHPREAIISFGLFQSWEADLAYAPKQFVQNKQIKFFLVVVDCLSHFLYVRTLTKRTTEKVTEAMRSIFESLDGKAPELLTVDKGKGRVFSHSLF